ncbi:unnamed protein product, partial [Mesorhabditis belari]|uniref:Uncharacterized protein n=1 Tax=Mesorhabditis belari TaxID=2138241 RepID=A0AAF3FAL7_9BILA
MPMPVWLWKPNREVAREPQQSDEEYRGCCNSCKTETCFKVVLGLYCFQLVGMAGLIPQSPLVGGLSFLTALLGIILGFMALRTQKPFYMQLFWILQVTSTISSTIILVSNEILFIIAYSQMEDTRKEEKKQLLAALIVWTCSILIAIPLAFWILRSIYTYYCYLRDRQIWIDQQWSPNRWFPGHRRAFWRKRRYPIKFTLIRDPVDRLVSLYGHFCENLRKCGDRNIHQFIAWLYLLFRHRNRDLLQGQDFRLLYYHAIPQSGFCNLDEQRQNFFIIRYSNDRKDMYRQFSRLFRRARIPKHVAKRALRHLVPADAKLGPVIHEKQS